MLFYSRVFFLVLVTIGFAIDFQFQQFLTCIDANAATKSEICDFVNWNHARMFVDQPNYYQQSLTSVDDQDALATKLYMELTDDNSFSNACLNYAKYFACFSVFPECPFVGNTDYFPPCRSLCEMVNDHCARHVDCTSLTTEGCMTFSDVVLQDGELLLADSQGPYSSMASLYLVVLTVWAAGAFVIAGVSIIKSPDGKWPLQFVLCVFMYCIRILLLISLLLFWGNVIRHDGVYPRSTANGNIVLCHINESAMMTALLLFASGWRYTRSTLPRPHAYSIIGQGGLFLIITSVVWESKKNDDPSTTNWMLLAIGTYGFSYLQLIRFCVIELGILRAQLNRLRQPMMIEARTILLEKYRTFSYLFSIIIYLLITDVVCFTMYCQRMPWFPMVAFYETSITFAYFALLWLFRPCPRTALFYMEPVAAWVDDEDVTGQQLQLHAREAAPLRSHLVIDMIDQDWINKNSQNSEGTSAVAAVPLGTTAGALSNTNLWADDALDEHVELTPLLEVTGRARYQPSDRSSLHADGWRHLHPTLEGARGPAARNSLIVVRSADADERNSADPQYTLGRWVRGTATN